MINLLAQNQFVVGLMSLIVPLLLFILFFLLVSIFVKKRSIFSGVTFLLFFSALNEFLILVNDGDLITNLAKFLEDVNFGGSIVIGMKMIAYPVEYLHLLFINLLIKMEIHVDVITFLNDEFFILSFYTLLFIASIVRSVKHKKEKRTYSDYDS